ncbi:MAG: ribosome biogenesis GTP-binding protein YihA/YsxC [Gammaproteobacteria bacterium]|nr:ribosome biogenesis GTP-binding protein YihA/YsxC [Gammaproteobacteria bacterium]
MVFENIDFEKSISELNQSPEDIGSEVAFVGRSNAGKSTAINSITNRNSLAKTSKTPGRTQLINFFKINDNSRFVDLPGYGFAKASKEKQKSWNRLVTDYIKYRQSLKGVVLIIDIRRGFGEMDLMFLDFYLPLNKQLHILLTKADKLSKQKQSLMLNEAIGNYGSIATIQLFSGTKKIGISEAQDQVTKFLESTK